MFKQCVTIVLAIFLVCWTAGCDDGRDDSPSSQTVKDTASKDEASPNAEAFYKPGPINEEQWVLPNGRMIWPAGVTELVDNFAIDLAVSPDGGVLVVSSSNWDKVQLIDTATMTTFQEIGEVAELFSGAVWNAAGDRFWVSGGAGQVVYEYTYLDGAAAEARQIRVYNYPSGLALSPDESLLYVSCLHGKRVAVVDLVEGEEIDFIPAHLYSLDVKITSDGTRGFVSNTGAGSVTVLDLPNRRALSDIEVGKNPEGLALTADDAILYVANSDSDTISVIETDTLTVTDTWAVYDTATEGFGASPVAVAVDSAGERLYVVCSGTNEITVFDTANGQVLGRIPTGWYPTNLRLDDEHGMLYFVSGKGYGSYGMGLHSNWRSTAHALDIPDDAMLATLTERQEAALNWANHFYDWDSFESPIPTRYGQPSEQIKHVIFVLKENKTYDQVLGDLEGTERDPALLQFGEDITPNQHALARMFTNCDNLFVEGDTSVLGHLWGTFALLNDHAEKRYMTIDDYPLPDIDPATRPAIGTVFERLLDAGIEFRSYGQIIGFIEDFDRYTPYIDLKYGFWNMCVDDVVKAQEIIREWEAGVFPPFIYISLPNDHNYGSSSGAPIPQYLMGDNDAGLGTLVEWVSHSDYWESTVFFVTEDDPQAGPDHIDPHRTIGLVIGPYVKHGHVSSVLYSMSSIWHTIDLILGIPPASKYSRYASPMYDCFSTTPDLATYTHIPNPVEFAINEKGLPLQAYCDSVNWDVPDQASRMGEVMWALTKPGEPFPHDLSLSGAEEEEDEAEEAKQYLAYVEAVRAYAKKHGLEFDALPRRGAP